MFCILLQYIDFMQTMQTNHLSRQKNIITTPKNTDQTYLRAIKGHRSDTKELNINIKTLTLCHLRQLSTANQLSLEQSEIISKFSAMPACFESITYLFFGCEVLPKGKNSKNSQEEQNIKDGLKQNSQGYTSARHNIRKQCKNLFRSTFFIKNFLKSSRMHFKNKLIILKYLRKIQCLPFRKFKEKQFQWKGLDFQT